MAKSGISVTVKKLIDESNNVLKEVDKQNRRNLYKVGSETRKTAKKSIRKRRKPSQPGSPPRSVTGLLRKTIFFWVDKSKSVITGPIHLNGSSTNVPHALEHGGNTTSKRYKRPINIRKRPFMVPAHNKTREDIRSLWKGV